MATSKLHSAGAAQDPGVKHADTGNRKRRSVTNPLLPAAQYGKPTPTSTHAWLQQDTLLPGG